ncbi:DEAD/DEAH box helicase [Haloglomus halophilum]|uniref:DEAD/DEAH box helicase n=1 Tax=Haloglomus halophilum TaxID=2962672 RepID=UPI0020C9AFA8|nr:DEAD/DEAH box helicase [Haloglomus halophilum]
MTDDTPSDPTDTPRRTDGGTTPQRTVDVLSEEALEATFPDYEGQVRHGKRLEARGGDSVPASEVLRPELADRLDNELWTHQAEGLDYLADGENVVVTTSTSSGKTWVYALQMARNHLDDADATALYVSPMKALARDQEEALTNKLRHDWNLDPHIGTYDGDTKSEQKQRLRENANIILTNPAGLNAYLPRHNKDAGWHRFYANLELVVIDEGHEYSGVTGTHVAFILRRLRRILDYYDADPQWVMTTATIGNPAYHANQLTGADFRVVDEDGSPRGARDIVLWEPPLDESQLDEDAADPLADFEQARRSTGSESASVVAHLGINDVQTLEFCSARQGTEIAAKQIGRAASDHPSEGYVTTDPYHAGLGKKERRAVETKLKEGAVNAVPTTNALELGIDIGSVDATVTSSYPGTKQSFWQQVGRAGRGESDALSVLVGGMDAMDSYIFENPGYLFDSDEVEDAVVSVDNDRVFADHLLAAASERPLRAEDAAFLGGEDRFREMVAMWQEADLLEQTASLDAGGVTYTGARRPQGRISLFGTGGTEFTVVCRDGEIDHDPVAKERAYRDYHEGALFLHAGQQYEVLDIDEEGHHPTITVKETNTREYTQTTSTKSILDLEVRDHTPLADDYDLYFGEGTVRISYDNYLVRDVFTGELVRGPIPTGAPPMDLRTELLWVTLPEDHLATTLDQLDGDYLQPTERAEQDADVPMEEARYTYSGGIHAAEHGIIQLAPLELMIDNADIGGLSTLAHHHETTPGPVWFVHDGIDGGIGFSKAIYEHFATLAERTREHIADCECGRRRGCPMCVMSEHCGNNNDPLDTLTGTMILEDVLEAVAAADSPPTQS